MCAIPRSCRVWSGRPLGAAEAGTTYSRCAPEITRGHCHGHHAKELTTVGYATSPVPSPNRQTETQPPHGSWTLHTNERHPLGSRYLLLTAIADQHNLSISAGQANVLDSRRILRRPHEFPRFV